MIKISILAQDLEIYRNSLQWDNTTMKNKLNDHHLQDDGRLVLNFILLLIP